MMILFYLIQFFLVIIFLAALVLLTIWAWTIVTSKVPFVSVPNSILGDIDKILNIQDDSVVYDLGCGDGRVVFYLSLNHPNARCIGIEDSAFPLILARFNNWRNRKNKNAKVEIINQDFFKRDLSDATHIFIYLYPNIMDDLLPKFDRELKSGTKLVSVSFKFTSKQPIAEIDLNRGSYKLARKIYVYQF